MRRPILFWVQADFGKFYISDPKEGAALIEEPAQNARRAK
jgi:hypothetical protein